MEFSVEGRSGEIRFQGQCSGVHAVEWADCREDLTGIIWIVKSEMDPAPKFSRQYIADNKDYRHGLWGAPGLHGKNAVFPV